MSLSQKTTCRADLVDRILRLDLPPGQDLDETRLAQAYGLSRTPLREVFQSLAGEGYVLMQPNRGTRVMPVDLDRLRSLFRTAPLLLSSIARQAAEQRDMTQIPDLEALVGRIMRHGEQAQAVEAAIGTHALIAQIAERANNPYLAPGVLRLMVDITRLSHGVYGHDTKKTRRRVRRFVGHHQSLLIAVSGRQADAAADAALALWAGLHAHMAQDLQPAPFAVETGPAGQSDQPV